MSRYFNNSTQLLRGGVTAARAATLAPSIERSAAAIASNIGRAIAMGRIPPPPAGAIPAAALILLGVYAYRVLTKPQSDDRIKEDHGTYWVVSGRVKIKGTAGYDEMRQGPLTLNHTDILSKIDYREQRWWGEGPIPYGTKREFWDYTDTYPPNQTITLEKDGEPVWVSPHMKIENIELVPPGWLSIPEVSVTPDRRAVSRPSPFVGTDRGLATIIRSPGRTTTNSQAYVHPLTIAPEIKNNATAATSALINSTIGFLGEGFDMTRCYLGAIGNTYVGKNGLEKVIPKSQWKYAINDLASGKIGIRKAGQTRGRVIARSEGFFNQETGRTIGWKEAGERLGKCLLLNAIEDGYYGARGKAVGTLARKYGFAAGPLGLDSLIKLSSGETPYSGMLTPGY